MTDPRYRPARAEDFAAIFRLWRRALEARDPNGAVLAERARDVIPARLADPEGFNLVAEQDDRIVGFINAAPAVAESDGLTVPGMARLSLVSVDPAAWGLGIGREMLERTLNQARRRGCIGAQLWLAEGNVRAAKLYEGAGFESTGELKLTPDGRRLQRYVVRLQA